MKINWLILISSIFLVGCKSNILEKNYKLEYDPNFEISLVIPTDGYQIIKVPAHILFYGHNTDFIILNQKPTSKMRLKIDSKYHQESQNEIFKTELNQFWIVVLKDDNILGPLNKSQYFAKRLELNIPQNLKLDNSTFDFFGDRTRRDIEYFNLDSSVIDIENLKGNK
jgi:hypothetical protein